MTDCSAKLHSFEVKEIAVFNLRQCGNKEILCVVSCFLVLDRLMHLPTWIDLKGEDFVPEAVHHVAIQFTLALICHCIIGKPKCLLTDGVLVKD